MQIAISFIKFLLIFIFTAIGFYAAFKVLVNPCDIYTPIVEDEIRCECTGIKFNLDNWLGKEAGEVSQTQCFGIITSSTK